MSTTTPLEVRLNARLHAVQRGDRYEDPLAFWLEHRFPGSKVLAGRHARQPAAASRCRARCAPRPWAIRPR